MNSHLNSVSKSNMAPPHLTASAARLSASYPIAFRIRVPTRIESDTKSDFPMPERMATWSRAAAALESRLNCLTMPTISPPQSLQGLHVQNVKRRPAPLIYRVGFPSSRAVRIGQGDVAQILQAHLRHDVQDVAADSAGLRLVQDPVLAPPAYRPLRHHCPVVGDRLVAHDSHLSR